MSSVPTRRPRSAASGGGREAVGAFAAVAGWRFALLCSLTMLACGRPESEVRDWREIVPDRTVFAYLPQPGESADVPPAAPYAFALRDPATMAGDRIRSFASTPEASIPYLALLMVPDRSDGLSPLWILPATPSDAVPVPDAGSGEEGGTSGELFTTATYRYRGVEIGINGSDHEGLRLYSARLGAHRVVSPSPRAVELSIDQALASVGMGTAAGDGEEEAKAAHGLGIASRLSQAGDGDLLVGASELGRWISTFSAVLHHPTLAGAFEGAPPIHFTPVGPDAARRDAPSSRVATGEAASIRAGSADGAGGTLEWMLRGTMAAPDALESLGTPVMAALGAPEDEVVLDRYIPRGAVAYALVRIPADRPSGSEVSGGSLPFEELLGSMGDEFAVVAMAESGFQSGSETLYLRELADPGTLRQVLEERVADGRATREGMVYTLDDRALWEVIAPIPAPIEASYTIDLLRNAAVLSIRSGLTSIVRSESSRRNVVRYDPAYRAKIGASEPRYSFIAHAERDGFAQWLSPVLHPKARASRFLPEERSTTLIGRREAGSDTLRMTLQAHSGRGDRQPYVERWTHNLPMRQLTSAPILADIGGTPREEILFSTPGGSVTALAADGTAILRVDTGGDVPIGPPVAYDWYQTRQNVLLQAAGASIYGWDRNGSLLPGFPIALPEPAVSGLLVADLTRDGLPELIIATADRSVHVLDARGTPLPGWPKRINTAVTAGPIAVQVTGATGIMAVAGNALHGWTATGTELPGLPFFAGSPFVAAPVQLADTLMLGATVDGIAHLWAPATGPVTAAGAGTESRRGPGFVRPAMGATGDRGSAGGAGGPTGAGGIGGGSLPIPVPIPVPILSPGELPPRTGGTGRTGRLEMMRLSDTGLSGMPVVRYGLDVLRVAPTDTDPADPMAPGDGAAGLAALDIEGAPGSDQGADRSEAPATMRTDIVLAGTPSGALLVFDRSGRLLFNTSLGQPASALTSPDVVDLFRDGSPEIVAVGRFGRLFAWDLRTGRRLEGLPPNSIDLPLFTDLDRDGATELIALTRDGLRCWTLNRP